VKWDKTSNPAFLNRKIEFGQIILENRILYFSYKKRFLRHYYTFTNIIMKLKRDFLPILLLFAIFAFEAQTISPVCEACHFMVSEI
jgi:hypothetical protein